MFHHVLPVFMDDSPENRQYIVGEAGSINSHDVLHTSLAFTIVKVHMMD